MIAHIGMRIELGSGRRRCGTSVTYGGTRRSWKLRRKQTWRGRCEDRVIEAEDWAASTRLEEDMQETKLSWSVDEWLAQEEQAVAIVEEMEMWRLEDEC